MYFSDSSLDYSLLPIVYVFLPTPSFLFFFFFNDPATTEIYTLSLHDALPILPVPLHRSETAPRARSPRAPASGRSEEHTSELQSLRHLVCRLLLEKKKKKQKKKKYRTKIQQQDNTI